MLRNLRYRKAWSNCMGLYKVLKINKERLQKHVKRYVCGHEIQIVFYCQVKKPHYNDSLHIPHEKQSNLIKLGQTPLNNHC